jgi:kumamolisin
VISISWGGPEVATTESFRKEFDETLQSAAALGITVTVASGDNGAADEGPNEWDRQTHADFPASSPYALACGATHIKVLGNKIAAESVWNQHAADTVDDSFGSSGGGDPASGYPVRVDGEEVPIGGTSAVAPLWAGLLALINQKLARRVGFINPLLYANPSALCDVTVGDNKVGDRKLGYVAAKGWDPCTGLSSPDGLRLLAVLGAGL